MTLNTFSKYTGVVWPNI